MRLRAALNRQIPRILISLVLASCISAGQSQEPAPAIRVSVNRVNIGVTVTDFAGHFVKGLHREDFDLFDDNVEQPITDFLPVEEPAQLLLLIESGPAVYFLARNHIAAADALLTAIAPSDRVAIGSYSKQPKLLLDFTADKSKARDTLDGLNFGNDFAELNLSYTLAKAVDWLTPLPGKKTIVLLSTGVDSDPPVDPQALQRKLLTSEVRILAVSLAADFRQPAKRKQRKMSPQEQSNRASVNQELAEANRSLLDLSTLTGGRAYFPASLTDLRAAYAEIAQLIRNEYSIAFAPPVADGQLHSVTIKPKTSGYVVDHRKAYIAPGP